jgi:thioesterase domain-containing protein
MPDSVPLFVVHGLQGYIRPHPEILAGLRPSLRYIIFELPGLRDGARPSERVEGLARVYGEQLTASYPAGPVHLAGFCVGAFVAIAMAHWLARAGRRVDKCLLVDPTLPAPLKQLFDTGRWKDLQSVAELTDPRALALRQGRAALALENLRRRGSDPLQRWFPDVRGSVDARAKLMAAVKSYKPPRLDLRTHVIASREEDLQSHVGGGRPSAWDLIIPNRQVSFAGETHRDVLASKGGITGRLMQAALDES